MAPQVDEAVLLHLEDSIVDDLNYILEAPITIVIGNVTYFLPVGRSRGFSATDFNMWKKYSAVEVSYDYGLEIM